MRSAELLLAVVLCAAVPAQAAPPSRFEIERAAEEAKRHPDLGGKKMHSTLKFRDADKPEQRDDPSLKWLVELARWFADVGRLLVWALGIVLAALVAVGLWRWLGWRRETAASTRRSAPTHVQSLDIRPETLPDDIGAAAAQLWRANRQQAALSLLYRGALSRLVHAHDVPVRAASTEGECVELARARLAAPRAAFFARLVAAWQIAVYGGRLPDDMEALGLCGAFAANLGAPAATEVRP
ncbi:MAG TPA: DUF4129 domain-containing protein [Ramlibacter sp.]|nr:DUF4129 domain-containing protein [Ramlibacter sp.]